MKSVPAGRTLSYIGVIMESRDGPSDALDALARRAEAQPAEPGVWLDLAEAFIQEGVSEQAGHVLDRAWRCGPDDVSGWRRLAELARRVGRLELARNAWAEIIERSPLDRGALSAFVSAALECGEPHLAESRVRAAMSQVPNGGFGYLLALSLQRQGRTEEALEALQDDMSAGGARNAHEAALWLRLSRDLGREEDTLLALQSLRQLRPDERSVTVALAHAEARIGDREQAERLLDELHSVAFELSPVDRISSAELALALQDVELARSFVVEMPPEGLEASLLVRLSAALESVYALNEAIDVARLALALDPTAVDAHAVLGRSLYQVGRLPEAVGPLVQVASARPEDETIRELLARALAESEGLEKTPIDAAERANLSGDLEHFALPEILEFLAMQYATGVLNIQSSDRLGSIAFVEGLIVDVLYPGRPSLDRLLIERGLLAASALEQLGSPPPRTESTLERALLEGGWVSADVIEDTRRLRVTAGIREMLDWRQGSAEFHRDQNPSRRARSRGFEPQGILMRVMQSIDEGQRLGFVRR